MEEELQKSLQEWLVPLRANQSQRHIKFAKRHGVQKSAKWNGAVQKHWQKWTCNVPKTTIQKKKNWQHSRARNVSATWEDAETAFAVKFDWEYAHKERFNCRIRQSAQV